MIPATMARFEGAYAGTPPWDIGRPQPALEALAGPASSAAACSTPAAGPASTR